MVDSRAGYTLFVSTWNLILNTVVVILFTKSAVPMPLPLPKLKPQPRLGFFGSPIVPAAALMTVLRSVRSCTAGVATAAGARMMPVRSMVVRRLGALVWAENMLGSRGGQRTRGLLGLYVRDVVENNEVCNAGR